MFAEYCPLCLSKRTVHFIYNLKKLSSAERKQSTNRKYAIGICMD